MESAFLVIRLDREELGELELESLCRGLGSECVAIRVVLFIISLHPKTEKRPTFCDRPSSSLDRSTFLSARPTNGPTTTYRELSQPPQSRSLR
jgi:hypothetical protein